MLVGLEIPKKASEGMALTAQRAPDGKLPERKRIAHVVAAPTDDETRSTVGAGKQPEGKRVGHAFDLVMANGTNIKTAVEGADVVHRFSLFLAIPLRRSRAEREEPTIKNWR